MKKKIAALIAVISATAVVLVSCYSGIGKSDMTITSAAGAGTRTFSMAILKDGAVNPDDSTKPVDQEFTSDGYFPKGIQAVVDLLNSKRPSGVPEIQCKEETDRYVLSYTISFKDLADFNAQTKAIAGKYWDENNVQPAAITTSKASGGTKVTYTEDLMLDYVCDQWASHALFDDTTGVYNVTLANSAGVTPDGPTTCIYYTDNVAVDIGGTVTNFGKNATTVEATGVIKDAAVSSSSKKSSAVSSSKAASVASETSTSSAHTSSNPNTGDKAGSMAAAVLLMGVLSAMFAVRSKKR